MNHLIAAMFKLPLDMCLSGMDAFITSVRGFQNVYDQQLDTIAVGLLSQQPAPPRQPWTLIGDQTDATPDPGCNCGPQCCQTFFNSAEPTQSERETPLTNRSEENPMSVQNQCESVKLISYKISFVKEGLETVLLRDGEDIVSDASDCGTSFEVWKTAQFMQELQERPRPIPGAWKEGDEIIYPPEKYRTDCPHSGIRECYNGLPEDDKKFLRFYQETLATYERETTNYQEEQADALKSIARQIREGVRTYH